MGYVSSCSLAKGLSGVGYIESEMVEGLGPELFVAYELSLLVVGIVGLAEIVEVFETEGTVGAWELVGIVASFGAEEASIVEKQGPVLDPSCFLDL